MGALSTTTSLSFLPLVPLPFHFPHFFEERHEKRETLLFGEGNLFDGFAAALREID